MYDYCTVEHMVVIEILVGLWGDSETNHHKCCLAVVYTYAP